MQQKYTWVVDPWSPPLTLVVGVLDFLWQQQICLKLEDARKYLVLDIYC